MLRNRGGKKQSVYDDNDEKGNKMKRQEQARVKSTILFLIVFCFIAGIAMLSFNDSTDWHPFRGDGKFSSSLRSKMRELQNKHNSKKSSSTGGVKRHTLLPPDSIYHLQVEDCEHNKVDLEEFAGKVKNCQN